MTRSPRPDLTPEQARRVRELLHEAAHLAPAASEAFVRRRCDDEIVCREVLSLLNAAHETHDFLEIPAQLPREPDPEPRLPKKIGRYTVRSEISKGGMGAIYLAHQDHPNRRVALKVIRSGLVSESLLRRFEHESQILGHLHHPNIAQIYEAGQYTDTSGAQLPFFAMEYLPGARLITEYAEAKDLSTRDRLELFVKVCEAANHGHQKGIIHRDLKPANILVDSSGVPKIIDFGVARATDSDIALTTVSTDFGQLVGTPQYMSPEQCDGDPHDLDIRSDVYSLGVILYELLCRRLPYDVGRIPPHQAVIVIKGETPARPSTIDRALRGDLETIVLKAIEKDRDRRYRSALDLADDIRRYVNDQPIEARPPSLRYQAMKYARRHRAAVVAAFVAVVALTLGLAASIASAASQARQRRIAEASQVAMHRMAEMTFDSFSSLIAEYPGSLETAKTVATEGLVHLEGLLGEIDEAVGESPWVQIDLAHGHRRVAELLGGKRGPNLGRREEAIAHARTALAINERVADEQPELRENTMGLARSLLLVGDLLGTDSPELMAESTSVQLAHCERAHEIAEHLIALDPTDDEARRLVAITASSVGDVYASRNSLSTAQAYYDRSARIREARAAERPENDEAQRDLGTSVGRLGRILLRQGDHEGALREYQRLLLHRTRAAERFPDSPRRLRDIMVAHTLVASALIKLERWREAADQLALAIDIGEGVSLALPEDGRIRSDRAQALYNFACCLQQDGRPAEALRAVEELERLTERTPVKETPRELISDLREELTLALGKRGDAQAAEEPPR